MKKNSVLVIKMSKVLQYSFLCIFTTILATACSEFDTIGDEEQALLANDMNANLNSMTLVGTELNESIGRLERIETYKKPRILQVKDVDMKKHGLGARVFVDWTGPIEPLMQEVAAYTNYKLKTIGMAPAIPVIVNVSHDDIEVGDIVREVHLQAKNRANVVIYPKSKTIELRYSEIG